MTRDEMLIEYEEQGVMECGTSKIMLEIPTVFMKDLCERGFLGNENKIVECFDRVLSDVKQGNTRTIGQFDREILEMFKAAFGYVKYLEDVKAMAMESEDEDD